MFLFIIISTNRLEEGLMRGGFVVMELCFCHGEFGPQKTYRATAISDMILVVARPILHKDVGVADCTRDYLVATFVFLVHRKEPRTIGAQPTRVRRLIVLLYLVGEDIIRAHPAVDIQRTGAFMLIIRDLERLATMRAIFETIRAF